MAGQTDEITRRRIDKSEPDYVLVLEILGYRIGNTNNVRWRISPLEYTSNIDPSDREYLADILEKSVEVLRNPQ